MRVFRGFQPDMVSRPTVAAMGNFDGVHLGHRLLLEKVVEVRRKRGLLACAVTFYPHPLRILAPHRAPAMLQTLEERLEYLGKYGLDLVVVVPFTYTFSRIPAQEFVEEHLGKRLKCEYLVVGPDARFGRDREGNADMLARRRHESRMAVEVADAILHGGVPVSSSRIRGLVASGAVEKVCPMLGRPYSLSGEVVRGHGRGRSLGFPTANVETEDVARPGPGVYACVARTGDGRLWPAAVHAGSVPTFGCERPVIEAYLVGLSRDIVGQRLRVYFIERLRGVRKFDDAAALRAAIAEDVDRASRIAEPYLDLAYLDGWPVVAIGP